MSPSSAVYTEDDGLLSRAMTFSLPFCLPVTCSTAGRKRWGENGRHLAAGSSGSIVTAVCKLAKKDRD
jgi:hypothetical protein